MTRPSRTGSKTSAAKARNAGPAKGRKTIKTKPRIAPAATRVKRRSISEDLKEAREQQAATAEILKVIATSPDDVQPVFDAIAHSAKQLIGGFSTAVHRIIEDIDYLVAFTQTNPESDAALKAAFPRHLSKVPAIALGIRNGETAQIADAETADEVIRIRISLILEGFKEGLRAGVRDGAEVVHQLLAGHAQSGVGDGEAHHQR